MAKKYDIVEIESCDNPCSKCPIVEWCCSEIPKDTNLGTGQTRFDLYSLMSECVTYPNTIIKLVDYE